MAVVADFTYCIAGGGHPLSPPFTVQFTDTSTGSPTHWIWDFGDGTEISTAQNPLHTYNTVGPFTVKLKAFIETSTSNKFNIEPGADLLRKRTPVPVATEAIAWTDFLAESFAPIAHALLVSYEYDNISSTHRYTGSKGLNVIYDLSAFGPNAHGTLFLKFDSVTSLGGGHTFTLNDTTITAVNNSTIVALDVTSSIGSTITLNAIEDSNYLSRFGMGLGAGSHGFRVRLGAGSSFVKIQNYTDSDEISKAIEGLTAEFDVSSTSGDFLGGKVVGRSVLRVVFRDLTSGGVPTAWSWEKRVAGTSETDEVRAPASLPGIITTAKANIEGVTIKNITKTTTYSAGTDYNITNAAAGEITILATGSITADQRLFITYNSENAWVEFSTDQNPTHNFDKDSP